ncbi:MerR family transcriptional regulator [Haloechinothrix halophila]|uniref:MerR family transcriptional regulator n=1 Tax=Haloechinothrix halophila TaxID=1069073 RepID=UPI00042706E8|nr:MerR family transcriptional regulator [Haloechinothrix halophila]
MSGEPTLPVAAVARRLGVAPATLRTWDRRYGLGPSRHTNGKHRRYSPRDIARLEVMQRALLSGASTAEAAQYALDSDTSAANTEPVALDDPALELAGAVPTQQNSRHEPSYAGYHVREDVGHTRLARRLSAATIALDVRMVQQVLAEAVGRYGPLLAWEHVVRPVLSALGSGWRGRSSTEARYLLVELALGAFTRAAPLVERPRNHHPVLLACPRPERAGLAVHVLAAALARKRIDTLVYSVALPADVLVATVRRTMPAAVVLWAQREGAIDPALFSRLTRGKQRSRLFACGPGWDGQRLPATVELLSGLPTAVERVSYVLPGAP